MFVNEGNTGREHGTVRGGCLDKIGDKVHISFIVDFLKSGQEEKGAAEDEMVGWYHQLNGREFEQTLGGQGGLACCSPWSLYQLCKTACHR